MKKTYKNPSLEIIKLKMQQQMLAGSPNPVFDPDATPVTEPGGMGAPRFDFDEEGLF